MNRSEVVQRLRDLWAAAPDLDGVTVLTALAETLPRESILVGERVAGQMSRVRVGNPARWEDTFTVTVTIQSLVPGTSLADCEARLEEITNVALGAVFADPTLGAPTITDLIGLNMGAEPFEVITEIGRLANEPGHAGQTRFALPFRSHHC